MKIDNVQNVEIDISEKEEDKIQQHYYIYLTTNLINNKKYIGKRICHCDIQSDTYIGSGKILKQAIQKYGKENFHKEILEICQSEQEYNEAEKRWIKYFNAVEDEDFYNIAFGGDGGNTYGGLNESELERIRAIKRQQTSGVNNPLYGTTHSEETRKKISEKLKDYYRKTGRGPTSGKFGEKNKLSKTIICVETNEIFIGIREASRKTSIPMANIIRSLKSDGRYSAGKYENTPLHWRYYNEEGDN